MVLCMSQLLKHQMYILFKSVLHTVGYYTEHFYNDNQYLLLRRLTGENAQNQPKTQLDKTCALFTESAAKTKCCNKHTTKWRTQLGLERLQTFGDYKVSQVSRFEQIRLVYAALWVNAAHVLSSFWSCNFMCMCFGTAPYVNVWAVVSHLNPLEG